MFCQVALHSLPVPPLPADSPDSGDTTPDSDSSGEAGPTQITDAFAKFEDEGWKLAEKATQEGLNCNLGKDPCTLGNKASMTLVPLSDADMKVHATIMQDFVIKRWAERCGADCAREWNETIGKVVKMAAPAG